MLQWLAAFRNYLDNLLRALNVTGSDPHGEFPLVE